MSWNKLAIAVVAIALAPIGWWWVHDGGPRWAQQTLGSTPGSSGLPVVMATRGGRLEVATVTVYERFEHKDVKRLLGLELPWAGKVQLQLRVVYRYYIDMERQWPLQQKGGRWIVRAGELKPTLPASFDTRELQVLKNGVWVHLDGGRSVVDAFRGITPELERRAAQPALLQLARDAGRKTVREFVQTWLLENRKVTDPKQVPVVVLFPGENVGDPQ